MNKCDKSTKVLTTKLFYVTLSTKPVTVKVPVARSPCNREKGSGPKSLKQAVIAPLPRARQQVRMSRVLRERPSYTDDPCHSRCGMLKNPQCSMALRTEYMLKCEALHR